MNFGTPQQGAGSTSRSGALRSGTNTPQSQTARQKRDACVIDGGDTFGMRDPESLSLVYPHPIQFYDKLPGVAIGLVQFEALAVERLKVLRLVEKHASLKAQKYSMEWANAINSELKGDKSEDKDKDKDKENKAGKVKGELYAYSHAGLKEGKDGVSSRERDHLSHFILRLAYCKTEELRRWFVTQETDLFRARAMQHSDMGGMLQESKVSFVRVEDDEMAEIRADLAFHDNFRDTKVTSKPFYRVEFTEALDLVRNRKVHVRDGICYVPEEEMVTLVAWLFKTALAKALVYTNKILPNLDEDDRLLQVLGDLDRRYTGKDYTAKDGDQVITPDMIQPLSEKSFPMCMRSMQNSLTSTHHLKYKARLQYGLFLKGIGLSLEDAIKFFRGEFTKSHVDPEKFDKEYTYGIRYNYGKEGKKVSWTPWNCMRIIMESVGPGENHGCPYRHRDEDSLRTLLVKSGLEGDALAEVLQLAKDGHYQRACSAQFKASHKGFELSTGTTAHPNQYYSESVKGGVSGSQSKTSGVKTERAQMFTEIKRTEEEPFSKDDLALMMAMEKDEPMEEEA